MRTTENGERQYGYTQDKVVIITDKFHGFIRYADGFTLSNVKYTDSHFIAFTTDHKIEDLLEAEIYYTAVEYDYYQRADKEEIKVYKEVDLNHPVKKISADNKGSNEADGWFGFAHKYEWERIEKLSDFYGAEKDALSSEAKEALERVQSNAGKNGAWILRFLETRYTVRVQSGSIWDFLYYDTISVSDVSILKLTFRTEGITYTMRVVDTMVTPDTIPDGAHYESEWDLLFKQLKDGFNNLTKTLRAITVAIGAVFGLGILALITYGIGKLIDWILAIFHRRK